MRGLSTSSTGTTGSGSDYGTTTDLGSTGYGTTGSESSGGVTDTAKQQAGSVAQSATESTKQVAGTAKQEVGNVLDEGKQQVRQLTGEVRTQVSQRVDQQRGNAASVLRTTGEELSKLADRDQQSRLTAEIARLSSQRINQAADYLENVQPEDLLRQLRSGTQSVQEFARRRPGAFLAGMALAGVVVGRLTRSAVAATTGSGSSGGDYTRPYESGVTTMRDEPGALAYSSSAAYSEPAYAGTTGAAYTDPSYTGTTGAYGETSYPDATTGQYAGTHADVTYSEATYPDATETDPYGTTGTTYRGTTVGDETDDAYGRTGREGTSRDV